MDTLITRLRNRIKIETSCGNRTDNPNNHVRIMEDALAELLALKDVIEPFSVAYDECYDEADDEREVLWERAASMSITVGHLRAAKKAEERLA